MLPAAGRQHGRPKFRSTGPVSAASNVMKRIAASMIGGVVTSAIMELLIYPAIYVVWRKRGLPTTIVAAGATRL